MMLCCVQDFAEAIAQVAMFAPGREALLQDPTVAEALQQVVAEGWTDEARLSAESALAAMSDRQPDAEAVDPGQRHVMMSCETASLLCSAVRWALTALRLADQWDVQEIVKRIVNELQARGYTLWFDLLQ